MARSILDELIEGFGRAVKDVREKVVEEPFYGKNLTRPGGGGLGDRNIGDITTGDVTIVGQIGCSNTHSEQRNYGPRSLAEQSGWAMRDQAPAEPKRPSFEEQWAPRERGPDQPAPPGLDIER